MGQNSSEGEKHYCRLLAYMLKEKGIKVSEGTLLQFLHIIIDIIPGYIRCRVLGKSRTEFEESSSAGGKLAPKLFLLVEHGITLAGTF